MKRQSLRKGIILISFLSFPVTIFYFSPVQIVQATMLGLINGSFITFTLMFLTSLFLGRSFCGWLCPGAGMQEACFMANGKKTKGGKWNYSKYVIWAPWILTIIYFAFKVGGYHAFAPLYKTDQGISVHKIIDYIPYYTVVGLIVIPSLLWGKRSFCHYICWMAPFMVIGTKIRNKLKWPTLQLKPLSENCIGCKKCAKGCPMSLTVDTMVKTGQMLNSECILCGNCIDCCPKSAVRYSFRS